MNDLDMTTVGASLASLAIGWVVRHFGLGRSVPDPAPAPAPIPVPIPLPAREDRLMDLLERFLQRWLDREQPASPK